MHAAQQGGGGAGEHARASTRLSVSSSAYAVRGWRESGELRPEFEGATTILPAGSGSSGRARARAASMTASSRKTAAARQGLLAPCLILTHLLECAPDAEPRTPGKRRVRRARLSSLLQLQAGWHVEYGTPGHPTAHRWPLAAGSLDRWTWALSQTPGAGAEAFEAEWAARCVHSLRVSGQLWTTGRIRGWPHSSALEAARQTHGGEGPVRILRVADMSRPSNPSSALVSPIGALLFHARLHRIWNTSNPKIWACNWMDPTHVHYSALLRALRCAVLHAAFVEGKRLGAHSPRAWTIDHRPSTIGHGPHSPHGARRAARPVGRCALRMWDAGRADGESPLAGSLAAGLLASLALARLIACKVAHSGAHRVHGTLVR